MRIGVGAEPVVCLAPLTIEHRPNGGIGIGAAVDRFRFLEQDYTVWVIHGRPNLAAGSTIADMAADYAAVLTSEFEPPVDVIGLSTGGSIALQLALDHPDLVRRLIVYSAACGLG